MATKYWTEDSHQILGTASSLSHYNRWIISIFKKYLGKNILEVGAGVGGLAQFLPKGKTITLSDIRDDYFSLLQKKFYCKTLKLDIEKESPKNLLKSFDSILSSNVFEHIKDDQSAFNHSFDLLKSGGYLCLFVPARPEIYGKLDDDMGHYRRYTTAEATTKAKKSGFRIVSVNYANFIGYFLWWGRGSLLKSFIRQKSGNNEADGLFAKIFDTFVVPLLYLENYLHPIFGQSVVLVAQKP